MSEMIGAEFTFRQLPDLDKSVPSGRHDDGIGRVGRETHTTDPFTVSLFGDGEFAVAEGVPEFNCLVSAATDDLSVVGAEGDGEDVIGVADEATGCFSGVEVPETEGLVPGGREGILAVGRDDDVLDKVIVALESLLWVSVALFVAGELPDNDCLVPGRGKDHVWIFRGRGQCSDPAIVALESSSQNETVCHDVGEDVE